MGRKKSGKKAERKRARYRESEQRKKLKLFLDNTQLTGLQSRFVLAFSQGVSKARAAMIAGYKGDPSQAGYQAFKSVQKKAPEVISGMGIKLENIIENHIVPKMGATDFLFAQKDGEFTDCVEINNHEIQLRATQTLLQLMGAFPPEDPIAAAKFGVEVIIMDVPRPDRSQIRESINMGPVHRIPQNAAILKEEKELHEKQAKAQAKAAKDPRPTD